MIGNSDNVNVAVSRFDGLKWMFVVVLVAASVYGNSYFSAESLLLRVISILVVAVVAGFLAVQTAKGAAFWTLLKEAKNEIRKVVWPTRHETLQTTLIVVVVVLLVGLVLWGLDSLLGWAISSLI